MLLAENPWPKGQCARCLLIVAYTVRRGVDGESIRIISAPRTSRKEQAAYAASRD
jgi:uncharacterized DUF497 family protein